MRPAANQGVVFRGELWWADLPKPKGSEPGFRWPVLVVQTNGFNRSRLGTVLAVAVTTNLALAELPGNVLVLSHEAGLNEDSVVNVTQVVTLDRDVLESRIGVLPEELLWRVEDGLRLVLGL